MEIAAGVARAPALHGVHAHRHGAVVVRRHRVHRMREAALGLGALAGAPNELATDLNRITMVVVEGWVVVGGVVKAVVVAVVVWVVAAGGIKGWVGVVVGGFFWGEGVDEIDESR